MAPSGQRARFAANLAAITTARTLAAEGRPATGDEQAVLARWSSWGALPQVFDEQNTDWAAAREQLHTVLDETAYDQARLTTINAHYTDPVYVAEIWSALGELGFTGGDVLEPGSGSGTFIGMAPENARMVGVELDATTAGIARGLYPQAEIHTESFAETRLPRGSFDAAVGNVPFANVRLYDPQFNADNLAMHNHFIVKSLELTRPGGVVAVLTSSFTMDAVNPAARRAMNDRGDLIGAVRLPSGAHRRAAGTEALTDLLIFRRREVGTPPADVTWETVSARRVDDVTVKINSYFDVHPDHVLGELHVGTGMYGNETVSVRGDLAGAPARLHEALADVVTRAREHGQTFTAPTQVQVAERAARVPAEAGVWDGTLTAEQDGTFTTVTGGYVTEYKVPKNAASEMRALLGLRDGVTELVALEASSLDDTAELDAARTRLREAHGAYVARYGALNRYTLRATGRFDKETGDPKFARIKPAGPRLLRADPVSARVMALEIFDDETQRATPAAMLNHRVVVPRPVVHGADTPADAVAISLDQTGGIDLELVADMLGVDTEEARTGLTGLVFEDPTTHELIHAPEYLSGQVRAKLEVAREAADADATYEANVAALREVVPADLTPADIVANMGAVWISPAIHQQFLTELLDDNTVTVTNPLPGKWNVSGNTWGVKATSEWGTKRRAATAIAESVMTQSAIVVKDKVQNAEGNDTDVINPVETTAAVDKAEALADRFAAWVWEDPARASELATEYNRRFNGIALRDYGQSGEHLTLPGLATSFTPRPHQLGAVARMIAEPAVGLFHQVGAGKTAEMVMGATELKRMGLINKPAVVVPNHMLEQFSREWLQMYPQTRLLAASSEDVAMPKRRLFVARAAANDWDAIIMTQTAFKSIGVSKTTEANYIDRQLDQAREFLAAAEAGGDRRSVKEIEKSILSKEEKYKQLLDMPRDPGMDFESTGIDYLIVDEAHMYKNLGVQSNIADANFGGVRHATDLHMKLEYLRSKHGARVATLATATPIANKIPEAYVMQQFLRPDLLEQSGIRHFDAWAATFGRQVTEMEMGPAGGFRMKQRLSKYKNVPEMLKMWHVFADVKTAEDLQLPTPLIRAQADGTRSPEIVVIQPTQEMRDYITRIGERAEAIATHAVDPAEDNMLLVSGDGRRAALDMRLVDPNQVPTGKTKLDAVADKIMAEWHTSKDNRYLDANTGEPSPIPGGLQLVFCDLSTPNPNRWNAYDHLKHLLVEEGMPAEQIRFMHEAKNDGEKARMFAAARAGHIAVLIGSTGKMGVGTNVQDRITAMHHVDCPWRPADLEQREGRGIRWGNQNPEVAIFRYVVEGSFDGYSWSMIARKAKFINQAIHGSLDVREVEDIQDDVLNADTAKAIASGNPLLLEKANADNDVQKLRRQETAYHRAQQALSFDRRTVSARIDYQQDVIRLLAESIPRTTDISGDKFTTVLAGTRYGTRAEAGAALPIAAQQKGVHTLQPDGGRTVILGSIGGHDIHVRAVRPISLLAQHGVDIEMSIDGLAATASRVPKHEFLQGGLGLIRQLENKTTSLDHTLNRAQHDLAEAERALTQIEAQSGQPFAHKDALTAAEEHAADVTRRLDEHMKADQERKHAEATAPQEPAETQPAPASESVTVTSQAELDAALIGDATVVIIDAPTYETLEARLSTEMYPEPIIQVRGQSRLDAYGMKVEAHDQSSVRAFNHGQVRAFDDSRVRVYDSSAETRDRAQAKAYKGSHVDAYDNSHVVGVENSRIIAWDNSTVEARQASQVQSNDNSQVSKSHRTDLGQSRPQRRPADPNTGPHVAPGTGVSRGPGMS